MSNNQEYIVKFKELYNKLVERGSGRFGDNSKEHFQVTTRSWLPAMRENVSLEKLNQLISRLESDSSLFSRATPTLEAVIAACNGGASSEPSYKPEDIYEAAAAQVIKLSHIDYSSFATRLSQDSAEVAAQCATWAERMREMELTEPGRLVDAYQEYVKSPSRSSFPPKLIELIHSAKAMETSSENPVVSLLESLYKSFTVRYGKYFAGNASQEEVLLEWSESVVALGANSPDSFKAAINAVKADPRFTTKAPQILDIVEAYFISSGNYPDADRAYQIAVGNINESNEIVSYTRKQVGANYLSRTTTDKAKNDFIKAYRSNVMLHARGELILNKSGLNEDSVALDREPADLEAGLSLLNKLLTK